jgi:serine/threonine protein kinase
MGSCSSNEAQKDHYAENHIMTRDDFEFIKPVGKGGFGKVWAVTRKLDNQEFAMKEMLKARVLAKRSIHSVINERKILSQLKHPFIVNMQFAFQDSQNLYLVMDLHSGGDLRYHLTRNRMFSEHQTKFFAACITHALSFIHRKLIIHRDIKPENLVFDSQGYLKMTDFGIARQWSQDNSSETSGTPGYMAPEVMCRQNHGVAVDFYALGVIAHECMLGRRPYNGSTRKEIRDSILEKQVVVRQQEAPAGWSEEAVDFVN